MIAINHLSPLTWLENTKKEIRSLLISAGSRDVTLPELSKMYKQILDTHIPFKEFNFTNLKDFLYSMPEVVTLRCNAKNELCVYHIDTDKSKHISYLVSKEKKKSNFDKSDHKLCFKNCVDPHILNNVLQEFKLSCNNKSNKVMKNDVLSALIDRIGLYSFYTVENLNNQLYELNHVLSHDDKYIYFKENFLSSTEDDVKEQMQNSKILKCKIYDKDEKDLTNIDKNSSKTNLDVFIKDTTKSRLQKLIEKHTDGIWCSELPSVYRHEYGLELEYVNLGFNSVVEFVDALPDIVKIRIPPNSKMELIINAKASLCNNKNVKMNFKKLVATSQKLAEIEEMETVPIPNKLSAEVSKTLIPPWAMNINETVEQMDVTLLSNSEKYLDVIISEVHNPSFFWIILRKNKRIINQLMSQLEEFYIQQDLDKYKIPEIVIQKGLHVACMYAEVWHRGIIKKIKPNGLLILFYDYGTIKTYGVKEVYLLDRRFSTIPAQALPCSLNNIKPFQEKKWSKEATKEFTEKVFEKPFIASIYSVDKQINSMVINIIETCNKDHEKNIDEWLVKKKLAEWGAYKNIKKNFAFTFYKEYISNMKKEQVSIEFKSELKTNKNQINDENIEIQNKLTQNYVNFDKKLKALEMYKENCIKFTQKSSLTICSDTDGSNEEKKTNKQIFYSIDNSIEKVENVCNLPCQDDNNSNKKSITSSSALPNACNFFYNDNNNKNSKEIPKSCTNKKEISNKTVSNDCNNLLNELKTLMISTKS